MHVEGTWFNGVQKGYGVTEDVHLFTDLTTCSTFGVVDATPEKVAARRDEHRREWAADGERASK